MRGVSLTDLPKYSPWPSRVLGMEPFAVRKKTRPEVLREYDREKFPRYLKFLQDHPRATAAHIKKVERGISSHTEVCISMNEKLYSTTAVKAARARDAAFLKALAPAMKRVDTVLELGAGYGYNLELLAAHYPKHSYIAGEFSPQGRKLSNAISRKKWVTAPFDFYDKRWKIFDQTVSKEILVLTCHSVEMLADASLFLDGLSEHKGRIATVVQFEPSYELARENDLLGLMRRKYIELNGYNRDLYSTINAHRAIHLRRVEYDVFGLNPLFPESLFEWNFKH